MPLLSQTSEAPRLDGPEEQSRPLVSLEGWARFEQRALKKRIDRRLEAARTAIERRRFEDAHAALDELNELDPSRPEITALTAALAAAERPQQPRRHAWAFVAAAAAFAAITLGVLWIGNTRFPSRTDTAEVPASPTTDNTALLRSYQIGQVAALVPIPEPSLVVGEIVVDAPVEATTGAFVDLASAVTVARNPEPLPPVALPSGFVPPPGGVVETVEPVFVPPPPPARTPATAPAALPNVTALPPAPAVAAAIEAIPAPPAVIDDVGRVRAVINQYQAAYDRLDARLAQTVWPSVNQSALARAFDDLEAQSLTFSACEIQPRGVSATAVCTGSVRYTPKVGSREPRVEPRVWSFTLRKSAEQWLIETARAER